MNTMKQLEQLSAMIEQVSFWSDGQDLLVLLYEKRRVLLGADYGEIAEVIKAAEHVIATLEDSLHVPWPPSIKALDEALKNLNTRSS